MSSIRTVVYELESVFLHLLGGGAAKISTFATYLDET